MQVKGMLDFGMLSQGLAARFFVVVAAVAVERRLWNSLLSMMTYRGATKPTKMPP
jgi:hypothetical protein